MGLSPGDRVDRYEVIELLGAGGMGEVYRARDPKLARLVALKILRVPAGLGADASARLLREARAAAALSHANVLAVYDVGEVQEPESLRGLAYIAMELVVGRSLHTYLGDQSVPLERRVGWLRDVAYALGAAHEAGIVHRDVKPENVMIRSDGAVKVLDFGIARRSTMASDAWSVMTGGMGAGGMSVSTEAGTFSGTPFFMAPEQLRGETLDGRTDQFAWGVMAYMLLTGRSPWNESTEPLAVLSQILSAEPPAPREVDPKISAELSDVIVRSLSKRREARFESMGALVAALEGKAGASEAPKVRAETPPSLATRRRPGAMVGGALLVAAAAVAAAWALRGARPSSAELPPVDASTTVAVAPTAKTPEAQRAWDDAMLRLRRGDAVGAASLERVLQLDPDFAPALLEQAMMLVESHPNVARERYRRALERRRTLIERDRALLDAFAPALESDPPDVDATRAQLAALAERMPNDGEIAYWLGQLDVDRLHCAEAIPELDRALQLDPESGSAALGKAQCYFVQGDRQGVAAALADCERAVPAAWQCLQVKFADEVKSGRCTEMLADARKAIVTHPDADAPYLYAAQALYAVGSPVSAVTESIAQARSRSTNLVTPIRSRILLDVNLAVLRGDFAEAEKIELAREADKAIAASSEEGIHAIGDWARVEIARESGLTGTKAADIAADHVARAQAWTPESAARMEVEFAFSSRFMGELAHAKRMSMSEYRAARAARIAANVARDNPLVRGYLWLELYAVPAETSDDAKEALDALPEFEPIGTTRNYPSGYPVGHVYQLAGRLDDALPRLKEAAGECNAIYFPFENTRAHFALGQVLEAKGDVTGACKSYAVVVSRWGSAKPRSVTGSQAKARMAALRCGDGG